jgi:hypothetical protein
MDGIAFGERELILRLLFSIFNTAKKGIKRNSIFWRLLNDVIDDMISSREY